MKRPATAGMTEVLQARYRPTEQDKVFYRHNYSIFCTGFDKGERRKIFQPALLSGCGVLPPEQYILSTQKLNTSR